MFTVEIHRVKLDPANDEQLLQIRGPAMVELQSSARSSGKATC